MPSKSQRANRLRVVIVLQSDNECLRSPPRWRSRAQRVSRFVFPCLTVLGVAGHQLLVTQVQRTPLHVTRPQDGLAKKRKKPDASTEIHPSAAETVPVAPEPRDSQTNGTRLSFGTADKGLSEQPRKRGQGRNCDCVLVTGGSVTGIL